MKLEFPKITIETSRDFENENFSLGDMRVIMELLSSKIYSRPKYIIVQEVASNARDANREVGREHIPIQIKLPSRLDDNIIIADSGPGITPERMSEVFLKYGASTKRNDNVLTGGFGIGAKTPFTYTDTFNVVTVTDDKDGRHQRTYIAHKSSNGFAKMSLVDTRDSTEDTGTAISFAIEKDDFTDFIEAAREVCRYWKVRPTITGTQGFKWPEEKVAHKGIGWELLEQEGYRYSGNQNKPKVLIDGIPYDLRLDTIFVKDRNCEAHKVLTQATIRMYFNVGEIDVSATREDLDYKDKTIKAIKTRAEECVKELRVKVNSAVVSSKSLWDASISWHNDSSSFKQFLVEPKWQGKSLLPRSVSSNGNIYAKKLKAYKGKEDYIRLVDHVKVTSFVQDHGSIVTKKSYGRAIDRNININNDVILIEDDLGKTRPNRQRLKTLFDKNPTKSYVTIIVFKTDVGRMWAKQFASYDDLPTSLFSTIPKAPKPKNANGKTRTINAIKVLDHGSARGAWTKQWQPCGTRSPEDGKGGVYVVLREGKPWLSTDKYVNKDALESIFSEVCRGETIYGVLWKYRNKVDDSWTEIMVKAKERLAELKAKPRMKDYIKYGPSNSVHGGFSSPVVKLIKSTTKLDDKSIKAHIDRCELSTNAADDYNRYAALCRRLKEEPDKVGSELTKERAKLVKEYPMLEHYGAMLNTYSYNSNSNRNKVLLDELIIYLNHKYSLANANKRSKPCKP